MSALDKLRRRFIESGELAPADVADLLNIATAAEMSALKSAAQLSESRRQVNALMTEREAARDIVAQAQSVVMQSLSALVVDLTTADRDVYVSVLAGAGVEITHQARDAADRSDEHTYCGQTIGEAVALCRADMQEST